MHVVISGMASVRIVKKIIYMLFPKSKRTNRNIWFYPEEVKKEKEKLSRWAK